MMDYSLLAVFLIGLLGGVHCLGMCGSIVGLLSAGRALPGCAPVSASAWPRHLAYNLGRVSSYVLAGVLVGALGQSGMLLRDQLPIQHLLFALSSVMLLLLGLYLAGISALVTRIERLGGQLWRYLQPLGRRLLPVTSWPKAALLGALWGWLPCGLVYSVLVMALASGDALQGGALMLFFGLGTLPNLLLIGLFWERARQFTQKLWVKRLAGGLVAGWGMFGLAKVSYTFYLHGWAGSCHVPV